MYVFFKKQNTRMICVFYVRGPAALKYYFVMLWTASHTFGNNIKITSFPAVISRCTASSVLFLHFTDVYIC